VDLPHDSLYQGGKALIPELSIIIPTYNERGGIVTMLQTVGSALRSIPHEVIVVDDNSPDGTSEEVMNHFGGDPAVRLITRTTERGLGTALRRGVEESRGEFIGLVDADLSYHPASFVEMYRLMENSDLVVGSRFVPGGKFTNDILSKYASIIINLYARLVLGLRTRDNTSGFLVVRKAVLMEIGLGGIFFGYGDFHIRLAYYLSAAKMRVQEIPVTYVPRTVGSSKTRLIADGVKYLTTCLALRGSGAEVVSGLLSRRSHPPQP